MFRHTLLIAFALSTSLGLGTAAAAEPPAKAAKKEAAAPVPKVSKEDIDLWSFSTINANAPGRTVEDFRALPNLSKETKDDLSGTDEPSSSGPFSVRFLFSDGLDLRVMDYGNQAFVSHLRILGGTRTLQGDLKIGSPRAAVEAVLGKPVRGGRTYVVYEGKTDLIRFFYTEDNTVGAVEIDRGSE